MCLSQASNYIEDSPSFRSLVGVRCASKRNNSHSTPHSYHEAKAVPVKISAWSLHRSDSVVSSGGVHIDRIASWSADLFDRRSASAHAAVPIATSGFHTDFLVVLISYRKLLLSRMTSSVLTHCSFHSYVRLILCSRCRCCCVFASFFSV